MAYKIQIGAANYGGSIIQTSGDADALTNDVSGSDMLSEGDVRTHDDLIISQGGISVPGDTNEIVLSLVNVSWSSPIENVLLQLSTSDSSISIINDEFLVENVIPSGNDFDVSFLIASDEMTSFGDIPFNLYISSNLSGNFPSGLELDPFFD